MPAAPPKTQTTTHPLMVDARLAILHDYLRLRALRPQNRTTAERQAERGLKAVRLAPTLHLCRALLAGEQVPVDHMDHNAVRRYGHRHRNGH